MDVLEELLKYLPTDPRKPALIDSVEIEWTKSYDEKSATGELILYSKRFSTIDGGDGWHGLDGSDIADISKAVDDFLLFSGSLDRVSGFRIRGTKEHESPSRKSD